MATGFGPKRQEGRAVPGREVAGWGLAQTLVGNLHCEESEPRRLVWNLPKPGGPVRSGSAPGACPAFLKSFVPSCTLVRPEVILAKATSFPRVFSHSPSTPRLSLSATLQDLHTCRPGSGKAC